jgi:hypothetical protein
MTLAHCVRGDCLAVSLGRQEAGLRFTVAVEEQGIIGNRFFDELLEQK